MLGKPAGTAIPKRDIRELVRVSLERVNAPPKPSPIKKQCLTCTRWLDEADVVFGYCPYCLEERARNLIYQFRPMGPQQVFPLCAECSEEIVIHGIKTWDTLGKSFKLVCIDCGYEQIQKDRQYRDTPWGYDSNLK